jgi:hypothetical protein
MNVINVINDLLRNESLIVKFSPQQVPDSDLGHVVHDELVVEQSAGKSRGLARTHRNHHSILQLHRIVRIGGSPAHSLRRMLAGRQIGSVVVRIVLLIHASQGHLAEQEYTSTALARSEAVVGRFGRHVCKIDSLTEHVTSHWGLGRSNAETLTENTDEVGQSASVPQQHLIVYAFCVAHILCLIVE